MVRYTGRQSLVSILLLLFLCMNIFSPLSLFAQETAYAILYSDGTMVLQRGNAEDPQYGDVLAMYSDIESIDQMPPWRDKAAKIIHVIVKDEIFPQNMTGWFRNCYFLETAVLNKINTAKVKDFSYLFEKCYDLISLDLSSWNTGNAINMEGMFSKCIQMKELNLKNFNTTHVTQMDDIFQSMLALKKLDISHFLLNSSLKNICLIDSLSLQEIAVNQNINSGNIRGKWYMSTGQSWNAMTEKPQYFSIFRENPKLKEYTKKSIYLHVNTYINNVLIKKESTPECNSWLYPWFIYNAAGEDILAMNERSSVNSYGAKQSVSLYLKEGETYSLVPAFELKKGYFGEISGDTSFTVGEESDYDLHINLKYRSAKSITVNKNWTDKGLEEVRPQRILVNLLKDGVMYDTQILDDTCHWTYTWDNLETYKEDEDGNLIEIEWSVKENVPVGYEDSHSKIKIQQETSGSIYKKLNLFKYWRDNDNAYFTRKNMTVRLWQIINGKKKEIDSRKIEYQTGKGNGLVTSWYNLPVYDSLTGEKIQYEVTEDPMEDYTYSVKYREDSFITVELTNTLTKEGAESKSSKDLLVKKIWDDKGKVEMRDTFVVNAYNAANGELLASKTIQPTKNSNENEQTFLMKDIPLYDSSGNDMKVCLKEDLVPNGYMEMVSSDGYQYYAIDNVSSNNGLSINIKDAPNDKSGKCAFFIKNTLPPTHRIHVTKQWPVDKNLNKPDTIDLILFGDLYVNNQKVASSIPVQNIHWTNVNTANYDSYTAMSSTDMTAGNYFYFNKYSYSSGSNGNTILVNVPNTYYYQGQICDIKYTGIQEKLKGYQLYNCMMNRSSPYNGYYGSSNQNNPLYTTILWDVKMGEKYGYNDFYLQNQKTNQTTITVHKKWQETKENCGTVKVQLMKEEEGKYIAVDDAVVTLNEENNWTYNWYGLERYQGGQAIRQDTNSTAEIKQLEIHYKVLELNDEGKPILPEAENNTVGHIINGRKYFVLYHENLQENTGIHLQTITNAAVTSIQYEKIWEDFDNADESRKEATIHLLKKAGDEWKEVKSRRITINEKGLFEVNTFDDTENKIAYKLTEDSIEGYQSIIEGNAEKGFIIRNVHIPQPVTISIQKLWKDEDDLEKLRPDQINVQLYANEKIVGTYSLSEESEWKMTVENCPVIDSNGEKIIYSVKEEEIPAYYDCKVTGSLKDGFVIENTHKIKSWNESWNLENKPKVRDIHVLKKWEITENYDVSHTQVYAQLYRQWAEIENNSGSYGEKKAVGGPILLSQNNEWNYTWKDLPQYYHALPILYTVEEVDAKGNLFREEGILSKIEQREDNSFQITNITTKIGIKKTDHKGNLLSGAVIDIYELDTAGIQRKVCEDISIKNDSCIIEGVLQAGKTYILHEKKAPKGYALSEDLSFTVNKDGAYQEVYLEDGEMAGLPNTGGKGRHNIWIIFLTLTSLLCMIEIGSKKRS